MKEYIERESLRDEIRSLSVSITGLRCGKGVLTEYMKQYRESVLCIVDEQPTADVQEVRHGRWEKSLFAQDFFRCSECCAVWNRKFEYCPHCGAKMEVWKDEI